MTERRLPKQLKFIYFLFQEHNKLKFSPAWLENHCLENRKVHL